MVEGDADMSTEYSVFESKSSGTRASLVATEGSGQFDLTAWISGENGNMVGVEMQIAGGLSPEDLAGIGLKLVQAALYNTSDDSLRRIRKAVRELSFPFQYDSEEGA